MNGIRGSTLIMARAITTPTVPPSAPSTNASPRIRPMTNPLGKPKVFSTAISVRRSRTAMLMVLAVTNRMVNMTANPMPLSSSARFPASERKLARKADSVSVRV